MKHTAKYIAYILAAVVALCGTDLRSVAGDAESSRSKIGATKAGTLLSAAGAPTFVADGSATLLKAFPGAEGFGAATPGGRGGQVLIVTTLDDYDPAKEQPIPGSLRAAVDTKGPRIIVFRVGGTIALKTALWIREPFVTIAGQTAPGGGICIRDYQVVLSTNDVILRHLRIRSGDVTRTEQMALGIFGGNNSIVDHCSMSWAIDEVMSSFGTVHNLTVQWSLIVEGLSKSYHPKGEHSKGSILMGDGGVTVHHCMYAHNASRNTRIDTMLLDFRNNVVYNWGYRCGYTSGGPMFTNYVNNYFRPGPSTRKSASTRILALFDDMPRAYLSGNVLIGREQETADNRLMVSAPSEYEIGAFRDTVIVNEPFAVPPVATDSPEVALERIIAESGATKPSRDSADTRLMDELRTGTGRIIDSQDEIGGWPVLAPGEAPKDADNDGMPDEWETANQLSSTDGNDHGLDADGDGYTNIEEFLNATDPRKPEVDCTIDKATFTALQQRALDIASTGTADKEKRSADAAAKHAEDVKRIIQTLKVNLSEQSGADTERITIDIGGATSLELVRIPAGSFLMGSPESEGGLENERPQHKVNISRAFYMGATPVTNAQFCALFGADARPLTDENKDLPVKEGTWFEGVEFCEVLTKITGHTFRLPTEAEWEYACRAGTTTAFNTGPTITSDQANFNALEATPFNPVGEFRAKIMPVRAFPPNAWGLFDMHGNEAEYCQDVCFREYTADEVTDPIGNGPGGAYVLRGGKSGSKAFFIRSASRYGYTPYVGYCFRVAMESK